MKILSFQYMNSENKKLEVENKSEPLKEEEQEEEKKLQYYKSIAPKIKKIQPQEIKV